MICVPIMARSNDEAAEKMARAEKVADLVELRVDFLPDPDLPRLVKNRSKPLIVTCRTPENGGEFNLTPAHVGETEEERINLLVEALRLGADFVDVEIDAPEESRKKVLDAAGSPHRIILSSHNFEDTPDDLESLKDRMAAALPGAVLKIVAYARSIQDNLKVLSLLKKKKGGERITAFCMGEHGEISRILCPLFGGEFTFGALEAGQETASGQVPASVLKEVYRVNELNRDTEIYGLIGNPVKESMGYLLHNKSYIQLGMNRVYLPFLVEDVASFIRDFKGLCKGFSVTMPFKQDIIPLLDEVDPTASKIGAVNTIDIRNGRLKGYNTDSSGAIQALESLTPLSGKTILMIGAGGVARAVGFGAVLKGAKIVLSDMDEVRAGKLAEELGEKTCRREEWKDVNYDILVNCSPIGMHPKVEETPFPQELLKSGTVVFDAVYNPLETRLLKEAAAAGCHVVRGVDLFINQAVAQFELWTGEQAPRDIMAGVVLERLRGKKK